MEQDSEKAKKVEDLDNFPFNNFEEFKKVCLDGTAQSGVDCSVALQWGQSGKYAPRFLNSSVTFLIFLPSWRRYPNRYS